MERGKEVLFSSALSKHSKEAKVLGFVGEVDIPAVVAAAAAAWGLLGESAEVVGFEVGHGWRKILDWSLCGPAQVAGD